ncbi:ABC transporter permease [Silvimonas sp.]|uniref:ABC transporter permease n=1 Tax=Silvimonas sp. TaxID=2650811 RepID=UPI00283BE51A|nr:ABC transporter permease [Silvimonas sp.]MDR3429439.1 ABC transporter permease [Silvimonas sp.]
MQQFSTSPIALIHSLYQNRNLINALVRREVVGRYRGSMFGTLWSFINPLIMLCVYGFFFSVVFKARWAGGNGTKSEFALILFIGMIVFNVFAECFNRAPGLVVSNSSYVKRVVFPLEILPVVALGAAFFHFIVGFVVWLMFYIVVEGLPHPSLLLLPVILLPFALFILGLSWIIASLGVFLRDVSQVVGVLTTALMFLTPIFFSAASLPAQYQVLIHLNPIAVVVEMVRSVAIFGVGVNLKLFALCAVMSGLTCCIGFAWFQKTRKGFSDVL